MKSSKDFFLLLLLFSVAIVLFGLVISFKLKPNTLDWKTYQSKKSGFEIQYPKGYIYSPCESYCDADKLTSPQNGDISLVMAISKVGYLQKNMDFKTWADQAVASSYDQITAWTQKSTSLNNYSVRKIDRSSDMYNMDYYLSDGKSIVKISVTANKVDSKTKTTVDQILSTFKFKSMVCKKSELLKECKLGPCCCPVGAMCD